MGKGRHLEWCAPSLVLPYLAPEYIGSFMSCVAMRCVLLLHVTCFFLGFDRVACCDSPCFFGRDVAVAMKVTHKDSFHSLKVEAAFDVFFLMVVLLLSQTSGLMFQSHRA